ncbi:DNA internalization-related competence protein ComEC/Rec2 [Halothiobacillus sp. DCM-1]|uniref:DNA internalization-related competence protein ComEC/Rec2 n=1 Tax=Halothiobacillus sp. DCM-1 TaxID=3112558 RepID=UPI0032453789
MDSPARLVVDPPHAAAPRWASGWLFAWVAGALLAWLWPFARPDWPDWPNWAAALGILAAGMGMVEPALTPIGVPLSLGLSLVVWLSLRYAPPSRRWHWARLGLSVLAGALWTLAHIAQQRAALPPAFDAPLNCTAEVAVASLPKPGPAGVSWTAELVRVTDGAAGCAGFSPGARWRVADYRPKRPDYQGGERWVLTLRLKPPGGNVNPGGLDYARWLFSQHIVATATVQATHGQALPPDGFAAQLLSLRAWWRAKLLAVVENAAVDPATRGLLLGLSIGDSDYLPQSDWSVLLATGTNHLLAISGLHVGMVAGVFAGLVAFFWRRTPWCARRPTRQVAAWVAVAAAWGYALLAGMSVPTERTALMMTIVLAGVLLGRPWRLWDLWLLALMAVLWLQPFSPLGAGFWLSFAAVWVLITLVPPRQHWRGARALLPLQVLLTLLLLPMVWGMFDRVAFASIPANLFAVPLITFVLTPLSLLIMVLFVVWPTAAVGLLAGMEVLVQGLMTTLSLMMHALPDSQRVAPSWGALALLLIGLLWSLAPRGWPARPLGLMLCLPALWPAERLPPPGSVSLWVFDVGQGSAALVQTRQHALLYDTGASWGASWGSAGSAAQSPPNAGERVVLPALRHLGVTRLDQVIISHAARDHAGGLPAILSAYPGVPIIRGEPLAVLTARPCQDGAEWQWDGVRFQTLQATVGGSANNRSCVLRVVGAQGAILLTGDIEAAAERDLAARRLLRAEVLVVPHHGSKTSSSPEFLAAVQPQIAIVSAGAFNPFGHPAATVRARYAHQAVAWYLTAETGAVHWQDGQVTSARQQAWPFAWRSTVNPLD